MAKHIFVTGGVVSSVGKGITVASIGTLLKARGVNVAVQKLDPYLNVDPGTMSPYQHGEVYVTEDGAETDLDLGHYERFIGVDLSAEANATSGRVYSTVINQEREGRFLGGTIQVVPHVTDEIKRTILSCAEHLQADVLITEIGGTVGDIEGQPFIEAIRQIRKEVGRENVMYIHVTYLPHLKSTGELKTKPTQHSVRELRSMGIQPDIIVCRSDFPMPTDLRGKIALFCDVPEEAVIPLPTVESIYEVPLVLAQAGMGRLIAGTLGLPKGDGDLSDWEGMVSRLHAVEETVSIALVGKYVELEDTYLSVRESLKHAALFHNRKLDLFWVHSEQLTPENVASRLASAQGIVVPGGFGIRGIEGMILAARYARENDIPYLGLCLGMQVMVIELARAALGSACVNSTEFEPQVEHPVIDLLPEQRSVDRMGGTMRLGSYPCRLTPNSKAAGAYGVDLVRERHRHRFEFNNDYREVLSRHGLVFSGLSEDGRLVEIAEIEGHPWMLGCQFHPEFKSRPQQPHPLFREFMGVALNTVPPGSQAQLPL
ncbi:MAG: CTP synthase [Dehalococcoidia bacterium]|nr:MAG: CTP synthase [Dehalococcoidia bacterium]